MKRSTRAAAILLLTGCLWAAQTLAQEVSGGGGGSFTLPHPVEWAGQRLDPGRYTVTVMPRRSSAIFIKVTGKGRNLLFMPVELSARDSGESRLVLVSSRGWRAVRALELAGLTATFRTPRLPDREPAWAASDVVSPQFVPLSGGSR